MHGGATRNVYVGNIEDFDLFSEERLKRDFAEYGEIELVNFLKEKYVRSTDFPFRQLLTLPHRNCAFVNFTNISNAIKAIENIKNKPDYTTLRVAHGKDRCANPPRSGPQGGGNRRTTAIPAEGDADGNYPIEEDVDDAAMAEYAMEAESSPGGGTLSTPPADS